MGTHPTLPQHSHGLPPTDSLFLPHSQPLALCWFSGCPSPMTSLGQLPGCHPEPSSDHSQACIFAKSQRPRYFLSLQDRTLGPDSQAVYVCTCWGIISQRPRVDSAAPWRPFLPSESEFISPWFLGKTLNSISCPHRCPTLPYVGPAQPCACSGVTRRLDQGDRVLDAQCAWHSAL